MFNKLFDSKKESTENDHEHHLLVERIEKMNLSDMRLYVKNNTKEFGACEDGLKEILLKLTTKDENTDKFYINSDDMASKKRKAFDLIILIAQSKKISVEIIELIQTFLEVYAEIISDYDTEFKEIYASRFKDAITLAILNVEKITIMQHKLSVLGE